MNELSYLSIKKYVSHVSTVTSAKPDVPKGRGHQLNAHVVDVIQRPPAARLLHYDYWDDHKRTAIAVLVFGKTMDKN